MATVITPRTQEFIDAHREEEPALLALKASRFPEVDMPLALSQIDGYQRAKTKIPSWAEKRGIIYPVHLSMEQCSSQQSALFKARVVECVCEKRGTFVDLTGGFGVDTAFVAPLFKKGVYVERQQELVSLAEHNFPLLGLDHVEMIHSDCLDYLEGMGKVNLIMLDPARRDGNGGRCVAMEDCTPSLTDIQERVLQCADHVLVKLSPMLDLTLALKSLRGVERIYLLSIDNECKEFLIISVR